MAASFILGQQDPQHERAHSEVESAVITSPMSDTRNVVASLLCDCWSRETSEQKHMTECAGRELSAIHALYHPRQQAMRLGKGVTQVAQHLQVASSAKRGFPNLQQAKFSPIPLKGLSRQVSA